MFFELFIPNNFFLDFLKEGMCPNVGHKVSRLGPGRGVFNFYCAAEGGEYSCRYLIFYMILLPF